MKFAVVVLEGPYQHEAADSAYQFVQAARARDHEIVGIFFYMDGIHNANKFQKPPGERNLSALWSKLHEESGVDCVACVAGSTWRGMNEDIALPGFRIAGLGQLAMIVQNADRVITFGG